MPLRLNFHPKNRNDFLRCLVIITIDRHRPHEAEVGKDWGITQEKKGKGCVIMGATPLLDATAKHIISPSDDLYPSPVHMRLSNFTEVSKR